jgi:hypothetical protein
MLVLPILLPVLLDELIDGILLDFERAIAHRRRTSGRSIWMRVRLIESSPGALTGLQLSRTPRTEADPDMEFDVDLDPGSLSRSSYSNESHLKTIFVLHWGWRELRRRMREEGRELAHLSDGELDDLFQRMADAAREPEAWCYRLDELVTYQAAILEREYREEEARCDTLIAYSRAKPLRDRHAAELAAGRAWWNSLSPSQRHYLVWFRRDRLTADETMIVAFREMTARLEEELSLAK